jgi:hypothetical protein
MTCCHRNFYKNEKGKQKGQQKKELNYIYIYIYIYEEVIYFVGMCQCLQIGCKLGE